MTAGQALTGIVGIALLILAAIGLHTVQLKLERWASNRPERQGRRSLMRDLFALTTIGLLGVTVACLIAPSAKALPGDAKAPNIQSSQFVRAVSGAVDTRAYLVAITDTESSPALAA